MITGFNTNVRHRGRTFHVQTEDSGRANPHVISHLYIGGTILASEKREYSDLLGSENLTLLVRRLMEKQHKAMLNRLKRGGFDEVIASRLEGAQPVDAAVAPEAAPSARDEAPPVPGVEVPAADVPAAAAPVPAAREFGAGLVSEKPLDEVILEYLIKKARGRKAEGATAGRAPRSQE